MAQRASRKREGGRVHKRNSLSTNQGWRRDRGKIGESPQRRLDHVMDGLELPASGREAQLFRAFVLMTSVTGSKKMQRRDGGKIERESGWIRSQKYEHARNEGGKGVCVYTKYLTCPDRRSVDGGGQQTNHPGEE